MASDLVFEKAIEQAPDDPATYLVYGDWLQSKGDPRGELIAVQAALLNVRRGPELARLKVRERELLTEHKEAFLGPLDRHDEGIEWFCGFIRNVNLFRSVTHEHELAVLEGPSGRFLRHADSRLLGSHRTLRSWRIDWPEQELGCLDECTMLESLSVNPHRDYVIGERASERLRSLHISPISYVSRWLSQLRTLPRLEQLGLRSVWPDHINDLISIVERHAPKELVLGLRGGPRACGDPDLFSGLSNISTVITSLDLDAMLNRENLAPLSSLAFPHVRELRIRLDD